MRNGRESLLDAFDPEKPMAFKKRVSQATQRCEALPGQPTAALPLTLAAVQESTRMPLSDCSRARLGAHCPEDLDLRGS